MKKGFTLIELLTVIVVLAVIAVIATPTTLNTIEKARMNAFKTSMYSIFRSAQIYESENNFTLLNNEGKEISQLNLTNNYFTGKIIRNNKDNELTLVTVGDNYFCANGPKSNIDIKKGSCKDNDDTEATNVGLKNYKVYVDRINVTFKAEDYESGIKSYLYCFNEQNSTCENYTETENPNVEIQDLESNTNYKLYLKAKNGNGIVNKEPKEFLFKTTNFVSPECSLNTDNWSIEKVLTCNYTVDDGLSYLYSLDESTWIDETTDTVGSWTTNSNIKTLTRTFNENTIVYVKTTDGYSNLNVTVDIDKIDNTNPTIPVLTSSEVTSNSITATYSSSKAASNIKNYTCYYGISENNLSNTSGSNSAKCVMNNLNIGTKYYFKLCATSNTNLTSCSIMSYNSTLSYNGIDNKNYVTGEEVNYEDVPFIVVSDNGDTVTLITKNNIGTGAYGSSTSFSTSTAKTALENWLNTTPKLKNEKDMGGIVLDSYTNNYVRLIKKEELNSNLVNGSGTNFWTLTASGDNVWYALASAATNYIKYTISQTTGSCYSGSSTSISGITKSYSNQLLNSENVNTIASPSVTTKTSGYTKNQSNASCYSSYDSSTSSYSYPCSEQQCVTVGCETHCSTTQYCGCPPGNPMCTGGLTASGPVGEMTCWEEEHCYDHYNCKQECTSVPSTCYDGYTSYYATGNTINYTTYSINENTSNLGYRAVITVRKR